MITVYYRKDGQLALSTATNALDSIPFTDMVWIDVFSPSCPDSPEYQAEDSAVPEGSSKYLPKPDLPCRHSEADINELLDFKLLTPQQAKEILGASEFSESLDAVIANPNFFVLKDHSLQVEPVSFVITSSGVMVSLRHSEFEAFNEIKALLEKEGAARLDGYEIFVALMQSRIAHDAEIVEEVSGSITSLSKDISSNDSIDKSLLYRIIELQERTMILRENTFDLQKVISGILRSKSFTDSQHEKAELMLNDVNSLISHADFGFQRLDYFQDTALGLINIQQNEIMKIFSIAAVIFMPPTLVASIYGMNFKYMPELTWAWHFNGWIVPMGYFFALFLMLLFTFLTVGYFKYKKWM